MVPSWKHVDISDVIESRQPYGDPVEFQELIDRCKSAYLLELERSTRQEGSRDNQRARVKACLEAGFNYNLAMDPDCVGRFDLRPLLIPEDQVDEMKGTDGYCRALWE